MDSCRNLIQNINLRKLWKRIRGRHLKSDRPAKMDSDSVVREMRRNTDMQSRAPSALPRTSLEYRRDTRDVYHVQYVPMTSDRIMQFRSSGGSRSDIQQPLFNDLFVHNDGLDTLDMPIVISDAVARNGIKVYKPMHNDDGTSRPPPRAVL